MSVHEPFEDAKKLRDALPDAQRKLLEDAHLVVFSSSTTYPVALPGGLQGRIAPGPPGTGNTVWYLMGALQCMKHTGKTIEAWSYETEVPLWYLLLLDTAFHDWAPKG